MVQFENGKVYFWGFDTDGYLGIGQEHLVVGPSEVQIVNEYDLKIFYNFFDCYFILTEQQKVFSWGDNLSQNLGSEIPFWQSTGFPEIMSPRYVKTLRYCNIVDVMCNGTRTYFLSDDGAIFFCGLIKRYEDVERRNDYQKLPEYLKSDENFINIAIIKDKTVVLKWEEFCS